MNEYSYQIVGWDHISIQKDTEKTMPKNVMMVSRQNFDRIVFRDKLEKYHNSVRSKLAEPEKRI
jgi:hypothetical protein